MNLSYFMVPTERSSYFHCVKPMNSLLAAAYNFSVNTFDRFIFLSENAIPVKPFQVILERFTLFIPHGPTDSDFCITPTAQWILLKDNKYFVKHHQWITLNRNDASTIVHAMQSGNDGVDRSGRPIPGTLAHSDEEFWHFLFLFSRFRNISSHRNLRYPSLVEQGNCTTYVYWPDYNKDSVFTKEIGHLHPSEVNGQHIIKPQITILENLRTSKSFFFARKFVDNKDNTFLPERMKHGFKGFKDALKSNLTQLSDAINEKQIYKKL